jgi:hypothetical protein
MSDASHGTERRGSRDTRCWGKGAQGVARMTRSGRREREGCGTGVGGRLTPARPARPAMACDGGSAARFFAPFVRDTGVIRLRPSDAL